MNIHFFEPLKNEIIFQNMWLSLKEIGILILAAEAGSHIAQNSTSNIGFNNSQPLGSS